MSEVNKVMDRFIQNKAYLINTDNFIIKPRPPDIRSKTRKFIDEVMRRLDNVWYAIKGGEFD